MNDMELEKLLTDQFEKLPPDNSIVKDITPWKRSIQYILWGSFFVFVDIKIFIDIFEFTRIIGYIFLLIGFRSIRCENKFFRIGFISAIVLNVRNIFCVLLEMSIWRESILNPVKEVDFVAYFIMHMLMYVCAWLGVWNVESKVGKAKHSKSPVLLPAFYVVIIIMGVVNTTGVIVIVLFVLYICLLVVLYKTYKSLEDSGYVIKASTIKIPNWLIVTTIVIVTFIGTLVVNAFNKYPMDWKKYEVEQISELEVMKQQLIEQGIPEHVVNDMPLEDIKQCADAPLVLVDDEMVSTSQAKDTKLLKMMSYVFCIDEDIGRLKIVHYFVWDGEPSFFGTELITYEGNNIINAENISGYIMYDEEGVTYRAPYYRTDYVDCINQVMGGTESILFTEFSFDREGSNYRGYFTYETDYIIYDTDNKTHEAVAVNYYHQNWRVLYPAQTARDYIVINGRSSSNDWEKFSRIRHDVSLSAWDD